MATKEQEIAELKKKLKILREDFSAYSKANIKIKTKSGSIEPLIFNEPQRYVHEQLEKQLRAQGRVRAVICKGRQQGMSTFIESRYFWRTTLNKGKQAYILAHDMGASTSLFTMVKNFLEYSHPSLRPSTSNSNVKELIFDKLSSGYKVSTAGGQGSSGRGSTIQYLHASEVAFWLSAEEVCSGVFQAVPDIDGTEIILESTANGVGNFFHRMYMQAARGESEFIAIFVPWFWTSEYTADPTGFKPTEEELEKQRIYGVTDAQLAWRRKKIMTLGNSLTDQEFPYCAEDSFIHSGRSAFDQNMTAAALKECWSPKKKMVLEGSKFVERKDGELSVWQEPQAGKRYVLSADVAEGKSTGDFSCADVLEVGTGAQCAQWWGHCAPDVFGRMLCNLGKWYGGALLGIEANNHGILANSTARDMNYPNLYVQTDLQNRGSPYHEGSRLGFTTTSKSKPYIIDLLAAALREGTANIACKETIQEMQSFAVDDAGHYNAVPGAYDDRVMSRAIGEFLLQQCPAHNKQKKKY